jgi:hypothetical protein
MKAQNPQIIEKAKLLIEVTKDSRGTRRYTVIINSREL